MENLITKKIGIIITSLAMTLCISSSPILEQNVNAATKKVKIVAKLSNTKPKQNQTIYLTVTRVKSGNVTVVCKYKSKNTIYKGKVGKKIPIKIGRATKGYKVAVNVTVKSGKYTYKTSTSFTPRK